MSWEQDIPEPAEAGAPKPPAPNVLRAGKEALLFFPRLVQLLYRLARDPEVPRQAKAVLGFTVVYLLSPIDIIPDFIPVLGYLDDLYIVVLAVSFVLESAGEAKVRQHWTGSQDVIEVVNRVNTLLWRVLPASIMKKIRARFDQAQAEPDRYVREADRAEEILLKEDEYRWVEEETKEQPQ
jgi:uncharacterized membrane protein YkvA (DUF1232 family)